MKHIFLYNPAAGQGEMRASLEAAVAQRENCEFYVTRGPRDATVYIQKRIAAEPDEKLCFVACGGLQVGFTRIRSCGIHLLYVSWWLCYACGE